MAEMADITKVAQNAIDEAMAHYFVNLATSGDNRNNEAQFLADVLLQTQGWLVFTEDSLQNIQDLIFKDTLHLNLVYTLTALFHSRFTLPKEDYDQLIEHLAHSFNTKECQDERLSFLPKQYADRIPEPGAIISILRNNRHLVMLVVFYTYGNPSILADALEK